MRLACLFIILHMSCGAGWAQAIKKDSSAVLANDSLRNDTTKRTGKKVITIETYAKRFDPRKALFYSAVLPGAGQVYNKKYWKVPLVIGGFWGLIAVMKSYDAIQLKYKNQLFDIINYPNVQIYPGLTNAEAEPQIRNRIDNARRQRDYFAILTGFFYILQMVDAHVDAHLKEFSLNPKLQVRLEPRLSPMQGIGMGITVRF